MIQSSLIVLAQDWFVQRQLAPILCPQAQRRWLDHCLAALGRARRCGCG